MKQYLERVLCYVQDKGLSPVFNNHRLSFYYGDGCYVEVPVNKGTIEDNPATFLKCIADNTNLPFDGLDGRIRVFTSVKRCLNSAMTAKSVKETWKVFLWRGYNLYKVEFIEDYDYYIPFGFRVSSVKNGETKDYPMSAVMEEEGLFSIGDYFNGTVFNVIKEKIKEEYDTRPAGV